MSAPDVPEGMEPWADDEAAAFLGALTLRFASEPETFSVFRSWVSASERGLPGDVEGHFLAAGTLLDERGPGYLADLAVLMMTALQDQLLDEMAGADE